MRTQIKMNRLGHEESPYLLQHAENPVDWYPWGKEAFEKAEKEDKPLFLSIGYSTCHWCHVMERESFSDPATAKLMNDHFVPVKVDREERPDIDSTYMTAVQMLTGSGGWPLSVFLTPEAKPFFGGTYFPPEDRWGMAGFKTILRAIAGGWENNREKLLSSGEKLTELIRRQTPKAGTGGLTLSAQTLKKGFRELSDRFDPLRGGFGNAPKFPLGHNLSFLLRYWKRSGDRKALDMVEVTLKNMARGGICDQLGGGFHRYSTDRRWLVPHFEKMLYDQAVISRVYLEAFQATGRHDYARTAAGTLDYVLEELCDPSGGFYSAEDADSLPPEDGSAEKKEGAYYLWTGNEIVELLGEENGRIYCYARGVEAGGNAPADPHGELAGKNILHLARSREETAERFGKTQSEIKKILDEGRKVLLRDRRKRPRPQLDDKILTDWNGLMIGSLARAAVVLEEKKYLKAAEKAAAFIIRELKRDDGRLLHRWRRGKAAIPAYLDDYAFLIDGLLELYRASFDPRYLLRAKELSENMTGLFGAEESGGLFSTGHDAAEILARPMVSHDGAIPSGNSVAALDFLRLGRLLALPAMEERGRAVLEAFSEQIDRNSSAHTQMLIALDFALGPGREIVISADKGDPEAEKMLRFLNSCFSPGDVVLLHRPGNGGNGLEKLAPYLRAMVTDNGKAAAYVCEDHRCRRPVTGLKKLKSLLLEVSRIQRITAKKEERI